MRALRDLIAAEAALAGLLDRRERELAVLNRLQALLPAALASQVSVADASRSELLLSSPTGAAASLLRHRAPQLLERLLREGWKFTGIRVRVQPRPPSTLTGKVYAKQMDRAAGVALRGGAARIEDGPLSAALRRLAECAQPGSEDEQQPLERVEHEHAQQQKQRVADNQPDETQVAPVALDEIQRASRGDRGKREEEKQPDDDHDVA